MKIINPTTEEIIREVEEDTPATVQLKFQQLKQAQGSWASVPLKKRIDVISGFHDLLDSRRDELAHTLTLEMGKPLQQSYNELKGARTRIEFFWIIPTNGCRMNGSSLKEARAKRSFMNHLV